MIGHKPGWIPKKNLISIGITLINDDTNSQPTERITTTAVSVSHHATCAGQDEQSVQTLQGALSIEKQLLAVKAKHGQLQDPDAWDMLGSHEAATHQQHRTQLVVVDLPISDQWLMVVGVDKLGYQHQLSMLTSCTWAYGLPA